MIRRVQAFATKALGLRAFFERPPDGRVAPAVPARALLTALLAGYLIRDGAFHAVEALVRSRARRALRIRQAFSDDTLAYFTERVPVAELRTALATTLKRTKRHKAFDDIRFVGYVLDGSTVSHSPTVRCPWCHPIIVPHPPSPIGVVDGLCHKLSLLSVVAGPFLLPIDVEPYGPTDCEQTASLRVVQRAVAALGRRFAQYVVADALYASAPFLQALGRLGLRAVVRLKGNVPTLAAAVQARFAHQPPTAQFELDGACVEVWDADDFDPWEGLPWRTVRAFRYRQHHRDGTVTEADWVTDFSARSVSTRTLYQIAKGRWKIENQGFNDGKTRYGLDHIPHHHPTSLLVHWLLIALTLTIERLYRLRYLHRGTHPVLSPIALVRRLRLSLGQPVLDSS